MFSKLRRRFTYANVAMTLALVLAMSGGAYAANKYMITSTKQISPKVLKSLKGANGAKGTQGPAGAVGPQGPAGAAGAPGPAGSPGAKGETGTPGTPGTNGKNGKEGSPWTAGGTLPAGSTETGVWSVGPITEAAAGRPYVTATVASFSIPLAGPLEAADVHYIAADGEEVLGSAFAPTGEQKSTQCPGTAEAPAAAPGNLCVYAGGTGENLQGASGSIDNPASTGSTGAATSGAIGLFKIENRTGSRSGTWAVTASE